MTTSIERPFESIYQFDKRGRSNPYLFLKQNEKQCGFGLLMVRQMKQSLPSVDWLKSFGLWMLGMCSNLDCHGRCPFKTAFRRVASSCEKVIAMSLERCLDDV